MRKTDSPQVQDVGFPREQQALWARMRENHARALTLMQLAGEAKVLAIAYQAPTIQALFAQAKPRYIL
jgi:hypothetical protein